MVRVGFDVSGEQQISRGFLAYAHEIADMSEPLDEMADVILDSVRAQFDTEGASGLGTRWRPLSDDYRAWKDAHYPGRPILVRTGGSKGGALNKRTAVTVTAQRVVYEPRGRAGEILSYHQAGDETRRLPQRKVVALTTDQKREAVDRVFSRWLNEQRRGAFAG